ncbi:hypothetical protein ACFWVB_02480 [Streptomyces microflavus]|uniref:hypothetical protein n=1 Tax=Streptomyces microflavus TaxID=1919 RepID=UPI0036643600
MSRPRDLYDDYTPSQQMTDAIKAWEDIVEQEKEVRRAAREAIAAELRDARVERDGVEHRVSQEAVARYVPWSEATVLGIAREYKVPGVRQAKKKAADAG